jgi:hypothetical protein
MEKYVIDFSKFLKLHFSWSTSFNNNFSYVSINITFVLLKILYLFKFFEMENNFLQNSLKVGLFDIGDSDDRLKWLQDSISDLTKKFESDHSLLPYYTLASLDPNISDTEPIMINTEAIITTHWKALRGKFSEMPRPIIRGVILNSLNSIGADNQSAARTIYLTATNFYPYAKLNSEKALIEDMLFRMGEFAEKQAVEEWSLIETSPTIKVGTLKITDLKFGTISIDQANIKAGMKTAILNDPQTNQSTQHTGNSAWGEHFANKSSEAIATSFNSAIRDFSKSLSPTSIETPINKFFTDFKKSLDEILKSSFSSITAVERRSKLLWWKETLYSSSQKKSYREVENCLLPILMSHDLNEQVPKITPISVDYLLKDTIYLLKSKDVSISFQTYFDELLSESFKTTAKNYFLNVSEKEGRITISDFICLLVNGKVTEDTFKSRTGIDLKEEITIGDLAVSILHDLLVQRLIAK